MHKTILLNNGLSIPTVGFGVYQIPPGAETERAVRSALKAGYRLIDTAAFYGNEKDVGNAIRKSGIPRNEIFVTTKLHPLRCYEIDRAFHASLKRLDLDYVDLYLIHWPFFFKQRTWSVLEKIYQNGYARAIGVSNYAVKDIKKILQHAEIVPAVNQVEFHPFLYRRTLLEYAKSKSIVLEAHSPLTHGKRLADKRLQALAKKYGKSPAQILIRWILQHGLVVIAKTRKPERMRENIDVFTFEINSADMKILDGFNENYHVAGLSRLVNDPS